GGEIARGPLVGRDQREAAAHPLAVVADRPLDVNEAVDQRGGDRAAGRADRDVDAHVPAQTSVAAAANAQLAARAVRDVHARGALDEQRAAVQADGGGGLEVAAQPEAQ